MSNRQKILLLEMEHSATGRLGDGASPEALAYAARLVESDARKAEAICLTHPELDDLQKIRSFLRRGLLNEANALLAVSDEKLDPEILLELARLALFSGKWADTVRYCDLAYALKPSGVTYLTLRQVSAVACLELGDFKRCHAELEIATSLAKLFPHGNLALYVEATQLKLWTKTGKTAEAEARLQKCWQKMLKGPDRNLDNCVLLLRICLEIKRQKGMTVGGLAFAIWLATRATGDDVYAALAVADIYYSSHEQRSAWEVEYRSSCERFARLMAEGTSSESLKSTPLDCKFARHPSDAEKFQQIVLIKSDVRIDLGSLKVSHLSKTPKVDLALRTLRDGKITRESFFREVWGQQKFSRDLHDGGVRRLIQRVRKAVPSVEIHSESGLIEARGVLLVDV